MTGPASGSPAAHCVRAGSGVERRPPEELAGPLGLSRGLARPTRAGHAGVNRVPLRAVNRHVPVEDRHARD